MVLLVPAPVVWVTAVAWAAAARAPHHHERASLDSLREDQASLAEAPTGVQEGRLVSGSQSRDVAHVIDTHGAQATPLPPLPVAEITKLFKGSVCQVFTPFLRNGTLDLGGVRSQVSSCVLRANVSVRAATLHPVVATIMQALHHAPL